MNKQTITGRHSEDDSLEIPKMDQGFFAGAIRVDSPEDLWEVTGAGVRKRQITLRVDSDVIDFFKQQGKGYHRLMNFALRAFMLKRRAAEPAKTVARKKRRSA